MNLETLTKLAESHQMGNKRATELLTAAGLEPSAVVPFGKGTMRLYDVEPARAALVAAVKAEGEAAAAAALAAMPPVTAPARAEEFAQVGRREILAAIAAGQAESRNLHARNIGAAEESNERADAAGAALAKLSDQNVLLLRALESMKTTFLGKLDALQESFDARIDALADPLTRITTPTQPISFVKLSKPLPVPKPRVAILGLFPAQETTIRKEFADVFDLVLIPGAETVTPGHAAKLVGCHTAFVMQHGQSKDGERAVKASGAKIVRINGSISSLRNALTDLFVAISDKKAA
jgi:seryl-tRNA synthetase